MKLSSFIFSALAILTSALAAPRKLARTPPTGFVYAQDGEFKINDTAFKVGGTNAYWMFFLNENQDVYSAFAQYRASAVKVVRVWAFREVVGSAPSSGNYTQLWQNGVATCSQAGLSRLDVILDAVQGADIKVILTLTNNWSVDFPEDPTKPPGYYSNTYGGMDTYVQQIHPCANHDTFYTDPTIISAYKKWLSFVIPAFKDHTALFSWELVNDPRCQGASGTNTTSTCNTATITTWVRGIANYITSLDSNHLVGAGDSGFFCTQPTCHKVSGASPAKRFSALGRRWEIPGQAYDGSYGIDMIDVCNDENVDLCSLQLFPDQVNYGQAATDTAPGTTRESINSIVDFINFHHSEGPNKAVAIVAVGITNTADASSLDNFNSTTIGTPPSQPVATEWEQQCAFQTISGTIKNLNAFLSWQETVTVSSQTGSIVTGSSTTKLQPNHRTAGTPQDGMGYTQGSPTYQTVTNTNKKIAS